MNLKDLLSKSRPPRFSASGPIVVILEADEDDNLYLKEAVANPYRHKNCMTDSEALWEEWSNVGLELFLDRDDPFRQQKRVVLWGHLWWERIDSPDYGTDYDGGFEVEGVLEP